MVISYISPVIFLGLFTYAQIVPASSCPDRKTARRFLTSLVTFPFSEAYLAITDGKAFNFHTIARDMDVIYSGTPSILTRFNQNNELCLLNDGMRAPVVLGSMPRRDEHMKELKEVYGLQDKDLIAVHTMNLPIECAWGGVSKVVRNDDAITSFHYPTVDECAPSMVDTLLLVDRLMRRDEQPYAVHYVHCLAGRGRSATVMAAYILCFLHKKKTDVSPETVMAYLKRCRSQVAMSDDQKKHIHNLHKALLDHPEGFAGLYRQYAAAMDDRRKQCSYPVLAKDMNSYELAYLHVRYCVALFICCVLASTL